MRVQFGVKLSTSDGPVKSGLLAILAVRENLTQGSVATATAAAVLV